MVGDGLSPPRASWRSRLLHSVPGSTLRLALDLDEIGSTLKPALLSPPLDHEPLGFPLLSVLPPNGDSVLKRTDDRRDCLPVRASFSEIGPVSSLVTIHSALMHANCLPQSLRHSFDLNSLTSQWYRRH